MIKIPNDALYSEGEKKLSPDETIMFSFLFMYHNVDSKVLFNISMLSQIFKFVKGNGSENQTHIKQILLSLQEKEYICTNLVKETKYDEIINGSILNVESGYSGFDSSIVDNIINENDLLEAKLKLHIYAVINRYGHSKGMQIDFEKISSICDYFGNRNRNYSVSKVKEIINEMDGKYIFRFSGNRKDGSPEQESNLYFTQISKDTMDKYIKHVEYKAVRKAKKRKDEEILPYTANYDVITVKQLTQYLEESNWHKQKLGGSYEKLDFNNDYFPYRFAKDENVAPTKVRRIEAAIDSLKEQDDCPDFDEWEKHYIEEMKFNREQANN